MRKWKIILSIVFILTLLVQLSNAEVDWIRPPSCTLTGCTMSGDINMDGNNIINALYVNMTITNVSINSTQVTNPIWVNKSGDTMTGTLFAPLVQANTSSWNRSGTDVFLANTGDKVGIGVPSPNASLHIVGNGQTLRLQEPGSYIDLTAFTVGEVAGFDIDYWDGSAEVQAVRIRDGKMVIGTLGSADSKLHVASSADQLAIEDTDDGAKWKFNVDAGDFGFTNSQDNKEHMTILNGSGNFGLGGDPNFGEFQITRTDRGINIFLRRDEVLNSPNQVIGQINSHNANNRVLSAISFQTDDATDNAGKLEFHTWNGSLKERMVIKHTGEVGIGTTTPKAGLEVIGEIRGTDLNSTDDVIVGDDIIMQGGNIRPLTDSTSALFVTTAAGGNIMVFDTTNERVGIEGIGAGKWHVKEANSGATGHSWTIISLEHNTDMALQFLAPNTASQNIFFGDPQSATDGQINYGHSTRSFTWRTNGKLGMTLNDTQDLELTSGSTNQPSVITLKNDGNTIGDGDELGRIDFFSGDNSGAGDRVVAKIVGMQEGTATTGQIAIMVNDGATEAIRIKANINTGFGTTDPDTLIHLKKDNAGPVLRFENNDASIVVDDSYGKIEFEGQDSSGGASGVRGHIAGVGEGTQGELGLAFFTADGNTVALEGMRLTNERLFGIRTKTPEQEFDLNGSGNVSGNWQIGGTLFGGSDVKIAGINITNNKFSHKDDVNMSLRFEIQNTNKDSNATAVISAKNDMGATVNIGVASSTFEINGTNYNNISVMFSKARGKTIFANLFNQMFLWLYNPQDDGNPSALVELMRLDGKGLNVSANITSTNVFIPQYIFSHDNSTVLVTAANEWTNISFDQEEPLIQQGISHTFTGPTNDTFTIGSSGVYDITYDLDLIDTSAADSNIDTAGRVIYENGTEIVGSVFETDITKKGVETELEYAFLAKLNAGDQIIFQFIAADADVEISTHGTFGVHPDAVIAKIEKIANLP